MITYILLRQQAIKDAKYIVQNGRQFDDVPAWMQKKADDYRTAIQRNINRKGRGILRIYSNIKKLYALMKEENEREAQRIAENLALIDACDRRIQEKQQKIAEFESALADCNNGKPAPAGFTMRMMHKEIDILNEKIQEINVERNALVKKQEAHSDDDKLAARYKNKLMSLLKKQKAYSDHDQLAAKYKKKLMSLEKRFTSKINSLHSQNERVRIACDEQFSYYWEKLQRRIELYKQKRKISGSIQIQRFPAEIKELVDADIWKSEKLFEKERKVINEVVNPEFRNHFDV